MSVAVAARVMIVIVVQSNTHLSALFSLVLHWGSGVGGPRLTARRMIGIGQPAFSRRQQVMTTMKSCQSDEYIPNRVVVDVVFSQWLSFFVGGTVFSLQHSIPYVLECGLEIPSCVAS
ncbi:hypothetical protein BKA93DRAFT_811797 [Sparassis latifolia]